MKIIFESEIAFEFQIGSQFAVFIQKFISFNIPFIFICINFNFSVKCIIYRETIIREFLCLYAPRSCMLFVIGEDDDTTTCVFTTISKFYDRCQTTNSPIRAWNIYESSPFSRKKFLSLCSIVKTTEWNELIKIDN